MAGKQDHLLAGKKKLEEFRKKKAADKAKKDAPPNLREKQSSQPDPVKFTDSNGAGVSDEAGTSEGAGISDGVTGVFIEASDVVVSNDYKTTGFALKTDLGSSTNDYSIIKSSEPIQTREKDEEFSDVSTGPVNIYNSHNEKRLSNRTSVKHADGFGRDQITSVQGSDSGSSKYSNYGLDQTLSNDNHSRSKDFVNAGSPLVPGRFGSIPVQNKSGYSDTSPYSYRDSVSHTTDVIEASSDDAQDSNAVWAHKYNSSSDMGERKFSSSVGHLTSATGPSTFPTESRSTDFNFDARNSLSNHVPVSPAVVGTTNTTRSRPSFLDSINTSKVSSAPSLLAEMQKGESVNSKIHPLKILAPSASQDSMNSFAMDNGYHGFRHEGSESNIENKHNFYLAKQNEDFAALEQHIEDLTHEKFSLQRALEASRSLAESLASENSALTDSYNQQGSLVHQLRSEMEKLQEEIKKHFVEVEAFKGEYANAQMECNAADERAKLLASEVIGLEEKALRLRSSELKLERQLENSEAEISSLRKKISSLEKDRQDLQLTIDALQEEKKLLQSKLRKASATGKLVDVSKSPISKRNVSTSTEDLVDNDVHNNTTPEASNNEIQSIGLLNESDSQYSLEGLSLSVPPDQMRMIQNINTLLSELAKEKEELANSLSAASSQSSKLKDLNKELSRKLEVQTQRLELLTAQSMANDNIPARQPDSRITPENTQYADEGDEVVERVLGWIMKLFPGGPSKRRTSKLL